MAEPVPLQDWVEAYKELAALITEKVPDIKWVDLWMEQTSNEAEEYPFPTPAVFLDFQTNGIDEMGENEQLIHMRVNVLLALDCIADTHRGSTNQTSALVFGTIMRDLHRCLHGKAGVHFGRMTRVGLSKEAAPAYVQLYSQSYATEIMDTSTAKVYEEVVLGADRLELERGAPPDADEPPLYQIP